MVSSFFDLPPSLDPHNPLPPEEPAHVDNSDYAHMDNPEEAHVAQGQPDYARPRVDPKNKILPHKPPFLPPPKAHKEPKSPRGPSPREPEGIIVLDDDYNGGDVDEWLAEYAKSHKKRKLRKAEEEAGNEEEEDGEDEEDEEERLRGGEKKRKETRHELEEEEDSEEDEEDRDADEGNRNPPRKAGKKVKMASQSLGVKSRQLQRLKRMRENVKELRLLTGGTHKHVGPDVSALPPPPPPPPPPPRVHEVKGTEPLAKKKRGVSFDHQGIAMKAAGLKEVTIDPANSEERMAAMGAERERSSSIESESHFDRTFSGDKSLIATGVDDGHSSKISEELLTSAAESSVLSSTSVGVSETLEEFFPRTPRNTGYALRSNPNASIYTPETGPRGSHVGGKGVSSPATPFSKMAKFYRPIVEHFHGEQQQQQPQQLMDDDQYQEILDEAEDALAKSKKHKGKEIPTKYAECEICTGMDDFDSLLHCTVCHGYVHPQCMTQVTLDYYDYLDDWVCENCHPEDTRHSLEQHAETTSGAPPEKEKILRARICEGKNLQFLVKSINKEPRWVSKDALENVEELAKDFLFSFEFARLISAKNVLPSLFPDAKLLPNGVTELTYRFSSNGAYFGIKQYLGVFSEETLQWMEREVDMTMLQAAQGSLKSGTSDYQSNMKRSKFFFGYGYVGYQYGKKPVLIDDVDPIPKWIQDVVVLLEDKSLVPKKAIDQAVLNVYHDQGAGLGVHQDPLELFNRPIYSIRLFSESVLSFGCRGLGMVLRKQAIPLPRGAITVMECFAANRAKHCVRPSDVHTKSASLLLRSINPTAKEELMQRKTRLHRVLSPPDHVTPHHYHQRPEYDPSPEQEASTNAPSTRTRAATAAAKKLVSVAPPVLLTPESEKKTKSPPREPGGSLGEKDKSPTKIPTQAAPVASAAPPKAPASSSTTTTKTPSTSPPKTPVAPLPKPSSVLTRSSSSASHHDPKPSVHKKSHQSQPQPQQQQQQQRKQPQPPLDSVTLPSVADLDLASMEVVPPINRDIFWERQRLHHLWDRQLEAQIEMHEQKLAQLLSGASPESLPPGYQLPSIRRQQQPQPLRNDVTLSQPLEPLWPQLFSDSSPAGWSSPYPFGDSQTIPFGGIPVPYPSPATQRYYQPPQQQSYPQQHHLQEQSGQSRPTPPLLPSFTDVFLSDQQPPLL